MDGHGLLYFVQLTKKNESAIVNQENLVLQDWEWDGSNWKPRLTKDIVINGEKIKYFLAANITSTGFLAVLLPVEYTDPEVGIKNELMMFSRYLEAGATGQTTQIAAIPTPPVDEQVNQTVVASPTAKPDLSILYDDKEAQLSSKRKIAGIALISTVMIVAAGLLVWRGLSRK